MDAYTSPFISRERERETSSQIEDHQERRAHDDPVVSHFLEVYLSIFPSFRDINIFVFLSAYLKSYCSS